ncbi:MAG: c-type cytochrome [Campylobacterota bacterium]|nr:c-type cytochrome [Campylobacterota bacterium]
MNKLVLWGIIITVAMLGFTYLAVGTSEGGLNGDVVNQLAVAGAVVLVIVTVFVVIKYVRQMQNDTASGELADENWDGIGEYKNDLPMGWAVIFLLSTIWAIWYILAGYPVNAYSQIGEYNEDTAAHNKKFEKEYAEIKNDPARLIEMGESVYLVQCAPCHGLKADGIDGKAAKLRHNRLDYASVLYAIENGSNQLGGYMTGMMPAGMASGQTAKDIATYVANGLKGETGSAAYATACAACHGANGDGMNGMAPNLTAFSTKLLNSVLENGKKGGIGVMPSFKNTLTPLQIDAVEAYVIDISK